MDKIKNQENIGFDAVKYMRQQRILLSEKLSKMTKTEIQAYFKKKDVDATIRPSA